MSSADTKTLIEQSIARVQAEIPAFKNLKLILGLELRGRGDVQLYRIELPGPRITKDAAGDARVRLNIPRSHFNELAAEGKVSHWVDAFRQGHARAEGPQDMLELIRRVVAKHQERAGLRRGRTGG